MSPPLAIIQYSPQSAHTENIMTEIVAIADYLEISKTQIMDVG